MSKITHAICVIITALICLVCFFVIGVKMLYDGNILYSKTCIVTEIDEANDLVTVSTASCLLFQVYGIEDNFKGDLVSVTFFSRFTPNVTDDMVVAYRYSGFTELFMTIEEGRVQ